MGEGRRRRQALHRAGAAGDSGLAARNASFESLHTEGNAPVLVTGKAVGEKIGTGVVRVITNAADLREFRPAKCWSPVPPARTGSR